MSLGIFIPTGNNGWIVSATSPQYLPTYELNRSVTQRAERYGFGFALAMVKFRGFGGSTKFWEYTLETFTLMSALAAVTERIKLYPSVGTLSLHPAMVARMASTIDSVAPGRFGINIVSGWAKEEYTQMGIWPGADYFDYRYDYSSEYVQVMRELWSTGRSDFQGEHFRMTDCVLQPSPSAPIEIVGAGQSPRGVRFVAEHGDYNFIQALGVNEPRRHASQVQALADAAAAAGRAVGAYVLCLVVAAETDAEAMARWQSYVAGQDVEALRWMAGQGAADAGAITAKIINIPEDAMHLNIGTFVGSYETVAGLLDEVASIEGTRGIMIAFDDFEGGLDAFGERVQPLMRCRAHVVR